MGEARGFFSSIYAPVQLAFEGDAAIPEDAETEASSEAPVQLEGLDGVLAQTAVIFQSGYTLIGGVCADAYDDSTHSRGDRTCAGACFYCDSDFPVYIGYADPQAQKAGGEGAEAPEEEIERMTTAEIEAELRAGMEQERIRRAQEQSRNQDGQGRA